MNSWKEKVADRLSRLLADSPSSPPSPLPRESPVVRPEPQLLPPSNEKLSGLDASFSSLLISPSPTVARSPGGCKSNRNASRHQSTSSPIRSISRWKSKLFSWKDRALDFSSDCEVDCRRNGRIEICEDNEQQTASESDVDSPIKLDEATPKNSMKSLPDLMDDSSFLSSDLLEFLESSLPNIVKGCQWILLYSTLKHGISLRTLLRRSLDLPGPCLLVAGDMKGAVFGGLMNCPLKPTTKRKYQGTHQTFVFTTKYGEPRLFRATGANRYYYLCLNDILAFGGGGNFALCLDGDLLHGTSGPCETFGNLCLAHNSEFELKNVELWGFTHSSRVIP